MIRDITIGRLDRRATVVTFAMLTAFQSIVGQDPTWRVNLDSSGVEANGSSRFTGALSGDGRLVAFESEGNNLVPGDTNGWSDVFVHDRRTGRTTRVSVNSFGTQGNGRSHEGTMSDDGRFVAFISLATNLVPGDTNDVLDVFVHDRLTGTTSRASVGPGGVESNGHSERSRISGDGRFVTFQSWGDNLVPGDTNGFIDAFVHDLQTGITTRVSVSSSGAQADGTTRFPRISFDGSTVSFQSTSTNLVPLDTNGEQDVFVHERTTGRTTLVSVSSSGAQADGSSFLSSISADGQLISFSSAAENLVPTDSNRHEDIFVHDRQTGATTRVSVDSAGNEGNGSNRWSFISGDGQVVAFRTEATDLVPGDTNGQWDVLRHDRRTGETTRVSVDSSGAESNGRSDSTSINADGRLVAFFSSANNLVPADGNGFSDVFVHGAPLILEADPEVAPVGASIELATWSGLPGGLALLAVVELGGASTFLSVAVGLFDAAGLWAISGTVPPGLSGAVLTFQGYGVEPGGEVGATNLEVVVFP